MDYTKLPQVDIIVLNYNGKKFLDDCFSSIRHTTYKNYRVYLLDNASTEDDIAYVQKKYPEVFIIRNSKNNGFCAAYNLAFKQCIGEYFLCLNNDVKVKPEWLDYLVEEAERNPKIAALQPKIVSFYDEHLFEYAGSSGGMMDCYGFPFLRGRIFDTIEDDHGQYNDIQNIFWTCGAAMFIRASALENTGLFDETIVHHMDEIDLNWRMHLMGYEVKVVPQSVILHYGGATIQSQSYKKMYWNHRNSIYIMLKNFGRYQALLRTTIHVLLDYIAAFHSIITFEFTRARAIISAHWWILLHLTTIAQKRKEVQTKRKISDQDLLNKMYRKSIVLQYYLYKKKIYSELDQSNN